MNNLLNIVVPVLLATSSATSTPVATSTIPEPVPTEERVATSTATSTPPVATTTPPIPELAPEPEPKPMPPVIIPPAATSTPTTSPTLPPATTTPELPATSTPTTTPTTIWDPTDSSFLGTIGAATRNAYALSQKLPPETTRLFLQIAVAAGIVGFLLVEQSMLRNVGLALRRTLRKERPREAAERS